MRATSLSYVGDVTALAIAEGTFTLPQPCNALLLAGIGSQLHVFLPSTGTCLTRHTVLPNAIRVHGIAVAHTPEAAADGEMVVAVHGDRHAAIYRLSTSTGRCLVQQLTHLPRLWHWSMDLHLTWNAKSGTGCLAVGLSDNSVELYELSTVPESSNSGTLRTRVRSRCIQRTESSERCLLYSMHLQKRCKQGGSFEESHYIVAGGTIYLDVVIWAVHPTTLTPPATSNTSDAIPTNMAPLLYKLTGHEGSIHRVRWSVPTLITTSPIINTLAGTEPVNGCQSKEQEPQSRAVLISASDDRTLRIWNIPTSSSTNTAPTCTDTTTNNAQLQASHVLYGHTARLWDMVISPDAPNLLFSCSEDGTFKAWDLGTGQNIPCLVTVGAHRGRGVWRVVWHQGVLYSGGNDSAVKKWNLIDWLPRHFHDQYNEQLGGKEGAISFKATTGCPDLKRSHGALALSLPDPACTAVGDVAFGGNTLITLKESEERNVGWKRPANSMAEWVKSMCLSGDGGTLYVATNRGLVHQIALPGGGVQERWVTVFVSQQHSPLGTLRMMETQHAHHIGVCDNNGQAIVLQCPVLEEATGDLRLCEWPISSGSSAVEVFFAPNLANDLVFTGSFGGLLTMWRIQPESDSTCVAVKLAEVQAELKMHRFVALDACWMPQGQQKAPETNGSTSNLDGEPRGIPNKYNSSNGIEGVVVTGNSTGGITVFTVSQSSSQFSFTLRPLTWDAKVHEHTPVRLIKLLPHTSPTRGLRILTGGGEHFVVQYHLTPTGQLMRCREERFDAIATVDGDTSSHHYHADGWLRSQSNPSQQAAARNSSSSSNISPSGGPLCSNNNRLVWGYHGFDFVGISAGDDAEVVRVQCGGWRRPVGVSARGVDDLTLTYTKDGDIVVYKQERIQDANLLAAAAGSSSNDKMIEEGVPVLPSREIGGSVRALHPAFHGREVNVIRLVPTSSPRKMLCLTSGEDSSLRCTIITQQFLDVSTHPSGSPLDSCDGHEPSKVSFEHCFIGNAAGGIATKTLSVLDLGKDHWLVVCGGAREVLMAWHLWMGTGVSSSDGGQAVSVLHHECVQVQLPRTGIKQNIKRIKGQVAAELRYLSVCAFTPPQPSINNKDRSASALTSDFDPTVPAVSFVLASTSDGIVSLLACHLSCNTPQHAQHTWPVVALLPHPAGAVKCLEVVDVVLPDGSRRSMAFTATTDGGLAVWDLTAAAHTYTITMMSNYPNDNCSSMISSDGTSVNNTIRLSPIELRPVLFIEGWHQSGVNAMSATVPSHLSNQVQLLTGGDDQALHLALFQFNLNIGTARVECRMVYDALLPTSHSSAVRSVWNRGNVAITVGLDQRVRVWKVGVLQNQRSGKGVCFSAAVHAEGDEVMQEVGCMVTQVIEPGALHVAQLNQAGNNNNTRSQLTDSDRNVDEEGERGVYNVSVGGRGIELMRIEIE